MSKDNYIVDEWVVEHTREAISRAKRIVLGVHAAIFSLYDENGNQYHSINCMRRTHPSYDSMIQYLSDEGWIAYIRSENISSGQLAIEYHQQPPE